MQVSFNVAVKGGDEIEGYLQLDDDDLDLDNRRYFVWRTPPKKQILLVGHEPVNNAYLASSGGRSVSEEVAPAGLNCFSPS